MICGGLISCVIVPVTRERKVNKFVSFVDVIIWADSPRESLPQPHVLLMEGHVGIYE